VGKKGKFHRSYGVACEANAGKVDTLWDLTKVYRKSAYLAELIESKRELGKADMYGNPAAEAKIKKVEATLGRMDYYHVGRCGRCARPLTVPASIINGIGPDCAAKHGLPNVLELLARNL